MGTKTAAIYTRISKDSEGKALGVTRQEQDCRELANRLGYDHIIVFSDNDTSASTLTDKPRPEFVRMMEAAKDRQVDAIIAYSNSRLTRRVAEIQALIDVVKRTGMRIHTVASGQHDLDTADGRAAMLTIAVWDQAEAERTGERIKRAKLQKAQNGEWHGGAAPYGYQVDPKTRNLVPNPAEVALIREATTRLLDRGQALHSIIVEWNNRGETTRYGHHWRQTGLRPILLNRSMLGETSTGHKGWEPIIDERTFDRLTALLTDPSRKVVHSPGANGGKRSLGGGLAVCGLCGKPLITHSKTYGKGPGSSTATLACLARVHGPDLKKHPRVERVRTRNGERVKVLEDTGRVTVAHDPLEELVFERVIAMLHDTERWKARMQEKSPEAENKLIELEDRRRELIDELDGVGRAVMVGAWDERRAKAEVARIRAELDELERRINALIGRPMFDAVVQEGKLENWRDWPVLDRRSFLRLFIDRIEVHPYPEGTQRTRRRFKNETEDAHRAAQWEIVKAATASRIKIRWKWESSNGPNKSIA